MNKPSQVWENPFVVQQDDFGRAIIILVVFNRRAIGENELSHSYHRYITLPENHHLKGRQEFLSNIRLLSGSFLNRDISSEKSPMLNLFTPSIGDYVLERYAGDLVSVRLAMQSLITLNSIETLRSLSVNKTLSKADTKTICLALLDDFAKNAFTLTNSDYLSALFDVLISCGDLDESKSELYSSVARFVLESGSGNATDFSFHLIEWAVTQGFITYEEALEYVKNNIGVLSYNWDIKAAASLLEAIPKDTNTYAEVSESFTASIYDLIAENLSEYIDVTDAFSECDYEDNAGVFSRLFNMLEALLNDLGMYHSSENVHDILESYDYMYDHHRYHENNNEPEDDRYIAEPFSLAIDQIDDLFDKG